MITHHVKYDKKFNIREFTEKYSSDILRYEKFDRDGNLLIEFNHEDNLLYWAKFKYDKWGREILQTDSRNYWEVNLYHEPIKLKKSPYKHTWLMLTANSHGKIECYDLYNRPVYMKEPNGMWHRVEYIVDGIDSMKKIRRSDGSISLLSKNISIIKTIGELEEYYDYYMQFYTEEFNHPKPSDLSLDENTLR